MYSPGFKSVKKVKLQPQNFSGQKLKGKIFVSYPSGNSERQI